MQDTTVRINGFASYISLHILNPFEQAHKCNVIFHKIKILAFSSFKSFPNEVH